MGLSKAGEIICCDAIKNATLNTEGFRTASWMPVAECDNYFMYNATVTLDMTAEEEILATNSRIRRKSQNGIRSLSQYNKHKKLLLKKSASAHIERRKYR